MGFAKRDTKFLVQKTLHTTEVIVYISSGFSEFQIWTYGSLPIK